MTPAIRIERLAKNYGNLRALKSIDLDVVPGEVFGFLGPNGAGKTTTIRVDMDFIRPSAGRASVAVSTASTTSSKFTSALPTTRSFALGGGRNRRSHPGPAPGWDSRVRMGFACSIAVLSGTT